MFHSSLALVALLGVAVVPLRAASAAQGKTPAAHKPAAKVAQPRGPVRTAAPEAPARSQPAAAPKAAPNTSYAVRISGSIIDDNGMPLPGATVWSKATHEVLAVANSEGEFLLKLPTNAPVALTCGYAGFAEATIELRRPQHTNEFVVGLTPLAAAKHQ